LQLLAHLVLRELITEEVHVVRVVLISVVNRSRNGGMDSVKYE